MNFFGAVKLKTPGVSIAGVSIAGGLSINRTSRATTLVVPKRRSAHTPFIPFSISTQEVHSRPRRPAPGPSIRPSVRSPRARGRSAPHFVGAMPVLVAGASQSQIAGWMERWIGKGGIERTETSGHAQSCGILVTAAAVVIVMHSSFILHFFTRAALASDPAREGGRRRRRRSRESFLAPFLP